MEDISFEIRREGELLCVAISGRMTTVTAPRLDEALAGEEITGGMILDIHGVEYISSFGLRVIMNQCKRCRGKKFQVVGANLEVMEIFKVTGFTEIMEIVPARKQVSVEGCVKIGAGACGECFRLDEERIIKLYYPHVEQETIEEEKALSKKAFVLGVPTAISYDIVECDGRVGVIYELINSKTIAELIREDPGRIDELIREYAAVCHQIHDITAPGSGLPAFKELNRADISKVTGITEEEREQLYRFLELVPESDHCVHGDLNINNIMMQNGECCLIDMGEFSTGTPMFDLSRIVFSMKYAPYRDQPRNEFYKLPHETIDRVMEGLLNTYFGCSLEEAAQKDPEVLWLEPLAWFRCVTSMLKGDRWPEEKRNFAAGLLREKLIPFIESQSK